MSKHIIRIVVTLLILSALGYVAWAFLIKPDNNKHVYANMLTVLEDINENTLEDKLAEVNEKNYYGTDDNKTLFTDNNTYKTQVMSARTFMFDISVDNYENYFGNKVSDNFVSYNSLSYSKYGSILQETLMYYMPYTQFAKNVTDEDIELYKSYLKDFKSNYAKVIESSNSVLKHQENNTQPNETIDKNLLGFYNNLLDRITKYYNSYADLIIFLRDFVSRRSSEGSFVYDTFAIYYNSAVYSIKEYMTNFSFTTVTFSNDGVDETLIAKNKLLAEGVLYAQTYNNLAANNTPADFELLNIYNNLNKNYKDILFGQANLFTRTNLVKMQIINNETSGTSTIKVDYVSDVQFLLEKLGLTNVEDNEPEEPVIEYAYVWHTSDTTPPVAHPDATYTGEFKTNYVDKTYLEGTQPSGWTKISDFGMEDLDGNKWYVYRSPDSTVSYKWKYVK